MKIRSLATYGFIILSTMFLSNSIANAQFGGLLKDVGELADALNKNQKKTSKTSQVGESEEIGSTEYIESPKVQYIESLIEIDRRKIEALREEYKPEAKIAKLEANIAKNEKEKHSAGFLARHWNANTEPEFLTELSNEHWFYLKKAIVKMKTATNKTERGRAYNDVKVRETKIFDGESRYYWAQENAKTSQKEAEAEQIAQAEAEVKAENDRAKRQAVIAEAVEEHASKVASYGLKKEFLDAKYNGMTLRENLSLILDSPDFDIYIENSIMFGDFILVMKMTANSNALKYGFEDEYGDLHIKSVNYYSKGRSDPQVHEFMTLNTNNESFFAELALTAAIEEAIDKRL